MITSSKPFNFIARLPHKVNLVFWKQFPAAGYVDTSIKLTIKYDVAFVWLLSLSVKCQFRPLTLTLPAHMAQVVVALQLNWTQN